MGDLLVPIEFALEMLPSLERFTIPGRGRLPVANASDGEPYSITAGMCLFRRFESTSRWTFTIMPTESVFFPRQATAIPIIAAASAMPADTINPPWVTHRSTIP